MRTALLAAAVCLTVVTGCGSDPGTLTIYSGRTEDLVAPILEDFTEATGIEVAVRYGDSADLALLVDEEGDRTPADVFLSQSPGAVDFLEQGGHLAGLAESTLALVPETVRDSEGRWVGFSGRQRVLVYNPDLVSEQELPDSVFDLTAAEWSGRLGIAPGNGSFQDFVTIMRSQVGDDVASQWLNDLAANDVQTFDGNSAIVAAVGRGEIAAGLVNHYYNYRFLAEDPSHVGLNHQFAEDDPGAVLIVTAAAILDSTDNREDADALVEYLLSEPSQRYFADETFEYPLASGVAPAANIPPATFAGVGDIDLSSLEGGLQGTRRLITDAGLEG